MSDIINILCATDNNFAPYCGVMLTSVFENNKEHVCRVYILVDQSLKKKNSTRLIKLGEKYGQTISFINVDMSSFDNYPLLHDGDHISIAAYYRLFVGELLPKSVNRVLYLDGDIIVTGDLSKLWEIDMTEKAVAAVSESGVCVGKRPRSLHYPEKEGYFNSGVLLINLDYWRAIGVGRQCIDFIEKHHDILVFHDQDVLNAVLWDKKRFIHMTYNFLVYNLMDGIFNRMSIDIQKEILDTSKNPCIIHYASAYKPWSVVYYNMPYLKEWKFYKKLSPWPNSLPTVPQRKAFNWLIKRYLLWPTGIMKYKSRYIK
jgi:lipopolysaccharide biosynthesis glycosyltransferase